MDVSTAHADRDSATEFSEQLLRLSDSGAGVIHVRTTEILRAVLALRQTVLLDLCTYHEWDIVNGTREFKVETFTNEATTGDGNVDFATAFQAPLNAMREGKERERTEYHVYVNPQPFIDNNPYVHQLLLAYNEYLPACRICVILVTPDAPLPDMAANSAILSLSFSTPGIGELRTSLTSALEMYSSDFESPIELTDDEVLRICYAGAGLSALQFDTWVSLARTKAIRDRCPTLTADYILNEVQRGKTEVVNSSDILELYHAQSMSDVGGMENLKEWVAMRSGCYSEEAREFGIESPKGMVLVGPPGTGKSLVAKATASVLGVPVVRMDFGKVFSSLVGSSEQRIRTALRMVESMAPVVLFCDEIDKGLGGISNGSGGDSGISMRVLGSFLTWLQDCPYPVFTLVTANNVDSLPPELLRRGRFDAIFSTSLPTDDERREIFSIHLAKRGRNIDDLAPADVERMIEVSDRYVPSELESAVKDALVAAFSAGVDVTGQHIVKALQEMVPLSKAFAAQIDRMTKWAKDNATPVSISIEERNRRQVAAQNRTRVSHRRRGA